MAGIYNSVTELIGHTPLLRANNFIRENKLEGDILVKLEYFNPAGSVKDRAAKAMVEHAEERANSLRIPLLSSLPAAIPASALPAWRHPAATGLFLPCLKPCP